MEGTYLTSRRDRIAVTAVLVWLLSLVIIMTGTFQPDPRVHVTETACAPGSGCPTGTECFAVDGLPGGRCVEPAYVTTACDWHETAAVAESYPQQVVCSTNPGMAAVKVVFAPVFAALQFG